jgi:thiamine biosynthesis lipoprotein
MHPRPPGFFRLQSALLALLGFAVIATPGHATPPPTATVREYVMGTIAEIRVYDARDSAAIPPALRAARHELHLIDRLMAVQRPASDVSRVNREAAAHAVSVDERVLDVLEAAAAVAWLTDGAFDLTVLPAVRRLGFLGDAPPDSRGRVAPIAGHRHIHLDRSRGTVRFTHPATQVDLGGIAKGYALDRLREILRAHGIRSAYLDLGGNIATLGLPPSARRWRIGIRHPRVHDTLLGVAELAEGSVSTSGDGERFVIRDGKRLGHIIDPRTGIPSQGVASATIITASATLADGLSTAAVVLGPRRTRALLSTLPADAILATVRDDASLALTITDPTTFEPAPFQPRSDQ